MKRKLVIIFTVLALCLSICHLPAFAVELSDMLDLTDPVNQSGDTSANGDTKLLDPAGTLDFSAPAHLPADGSDKGYSWNQDTKTLTLSDGFNATKVTLPDDSVKIVVEGESGIAELAISGGSPLKTNLTFSGTGTLTIPEHIEISGGNDNSLTVDAGAKVVANNGISIGASGVDGVITVNGSLTVAQGTGVSAIYGGKVAVSDTGVLEVSGEKGVTLNGMNSSGDFNDLFAVTGNGRFTASCTTYNVMVATSGSFPPGTTAQGAINLGPEYMPEDCKVELDDAQKQINLVRKSTGEVYNGPLTIHKNHIWSPDWTDDGEDTHYHVCTYEGCTAKKDEGPHYYAHGATACRDCGHARPKGAPDSDGGSSDRDSNDHDSSYTITVEKVSYGEVVSNRRTASRGDMVTLTITPDSGYVLDTLTVTGRRGSEIELAQKADGRYTFAMPAQNVTVRAAFVPLQAEWNNPYPDVSENAWYYEAVRFVTETSLMSGYGSGLFGPDHALTRAQFTQILHNREGRPVVNYQMRFEDVSSGAWYTEAVRWAAAQGIVSGYGNGRFGPDDPITREQLAVMLWRYAGSPATSETALSFTDADGAGGYALDALRWAVENGIITGKGDGVLDPKGTATRAEATAMLMWYLDK